jgi:tRNA(Ile)-lysidine synthase
MEGRFLEFISKNRLIEKGQRTLLTVSGGVDSMVLLDLFDKTGLDFSVVHCNFNLRGDESDGDEEFVRNYVERLGIKLHIKQFDTNEYAKVNGLSVEMAARELRYNYFNELCRIHGYERIATAHHQDDLIETFFINLVRKTGIKGLTGIKPKSGNLIRPLLFTNREAIKKYAFVNEIPFREDSSNDSVLYKRNYIRHKIIPEFYEINPAFRENILASINHLKEVEEVYFNVINSERENVSYFENKSPVIDIGNLLKTSFPKVLLFEILSEYQFNSTVISEIFASLSDESGKQFFSSTHRVIKDREKLIITENKEKSLAVFYLDEGDLELFSPVNLEMSWFEKSEFKIPSDSNMAFLDYDKLLFPLVIKKWNTGEYFQPLGMSGFKKMSDFFIDEKLSIPEKENTWILYSAEKVVWVMGYRIDDRFKITPETRKIYRLKIN